MLIEESMKKNIFVFLLLLVTVYNVECSANSRGKRKREGVAWHAEPHPYTISFFTFPKGAASELLEPKQESKRESQDSSVQQKIKESVKGNDTKVKDSKNSSSSDEVSKQSKSSPKLSNTTKIQKSGQLNILTKSGKTNRYDLDQQKEKVETLEPWSLGPFHADVQLHHHAAKLQQAESFQEGSVSHPSHTMYPRCHHCPSNSSYEDCSSKATLKRCDKGLNNICYTKSFHSNSRGVIYEMGCSNHKKCRKAKASPCKEAGKKCFVCCQFDECNALQHHYFKSPQKDDDDNFGYSSSEFSNGTRKPTWSPLLLLILTLLSCVMTCG